MKRMMIWMLFLTFDNKNESVDKGLDNVSYSTEKIYHDTEWSSVDYKNTLDLSAFKKIMGKRESLNNYSVVNRYGYMGKYQFGKQTLKGLGIHTTKINFLSNHELQEEAMDKLTLHNLYLIKRYGLDKYIGDTINGNNITLMGTLAACHLVGIRPVKIYFASEGRIVGKDGNKTSLEEYMGMFSDSNMSKFYSNAITSCVDSLNNNGNFN